MIVVPAPKPVRTWIPDETLPDGGSYAFVTPLRGLVLEHQLAAAGLQNTNAADLEHTVSFDLATNTLHLLAVDEADRAAAVAIVKAHPQSIGMFDEALADPTDQRLPEEVAADIAEPTSP